MRREILFADRDRAANAPAAGRTHAPRSGDAGATRASSLRLIADPIPNPSAPLRRKAFAARSKKSVMKIRYPSLNSASKSAIAQQYRRAVESDSSKSPDTPRQAPRPNSRTNPKKRSILAPPRCLA